MGFKYLCPFCDTNFVTSTETYQYRALSFRGIRQNIQGTIDEEECLHVAFYKCPNCNEISVSVVGLGSLYKGQKIPVRPKSFAKQFPDYIPEAIRNDYEEACLIVNLSPKASATLSRRCLQGMIRDFWNIKNKKNLYEEIVAIENKVSPDVARVLKGTKDLGNIGAHMEKDINLIVNIDSGESEKLIKLIEYLMKEWYINRHESEKLFNEIVGIDQSKKNLKKNNQNSSNSANS